MWLVGLCHLLNDDPESTLAELLRAREHELTLAECLNEVGRHSEALEQVLQLEPEEPRLVRDLAWANFRLKEQATTRMQIDRALALDPGDSFAW
ncbi:MAG: hypothetical protein AB7S38_40655 [Vulcanimicrobiota bacterium]